MGDCASNFVYVAVATIRRWYEVPDGRVSSWAQCFKGFGPLNSEADEILALRLAFYLASYGMYRGSSFLLKRNHQIFRELCLDIQSNYMTLRCISVEKLNIYQKDIKSLYDLIDKRLRCTEIYENCNDTTKISYNNSNNKELRPTNALITKIMFGALACIPAFDHFVSIGSRSSGYHTSSLRLINFIEFISQLANKKQLDEVRRELGGDWLPDMFIIDAYLWQRGYCTSAEQKKCRTCPF